MNTLMNKQQGDIIIILTNSWRYLAVGSVLALLCQLSLFFHSNYLKYILILNVIIFIISQYYIYRLWLDHFFFKKIYNHIEIEQFDNALVFLFPNKAKHPSMQQRWLGTKHIFNYAFGAVILQWIGLIVAIMVI